MSCWSQVLNHAGYVRIQVVNKVGMLPTAHIACLTKRVVTPSASSRPWQRISATTRDASLGGKQNLMGRWPHLHHHNQPHSMERSAFACKVSHACWHEQQVLGTVCQVLKRCCLRECSPPGILVVRQDDLHLAGAGARIAVHLDAVPTAVLVVTAGVAALVHSVLQTN